MEHAIKLLEKERELIVEDLKNGEKDRLNYLKDLDKALEWLYLLEEKQFDEAKRYNLEQLPFIEGRGGFSCYRIAIDNESDEIKFWDEYEKSDGSKLSLYPRDYIINRKY
jgi:hypothetical protein|nr:hypothetical protein [uncultured Lachnoanaerobaculum sp.]